MLIAIEGNDGAGKATQTKMLAERFSREGREAVVYSFPRYNTPLGKTILRHLKSETKLMEEPREWRFQRYEDPAPEDPLWFQCVCAIDKYEAVGDIVAHLRAGGVVICDRWKPSAIAFGSADGLDPRLLERMQEALPSANINIFLALSEEETLRRRPQLRDRYEKDREKQQIIRMNYARLWDERRMDATETGLWWVVDGHGTPEEVHETIWKHVQAAMR